MGLLNTSFNQVKTSKNLEPCVAKGKERALPSASILQIYRSQICCYSEISRTSSIHTVPAIWLSNLLLTDLTTLRSRRRVSGRVVNSACCSDQPEVPTRFSDETKILPIS